jgi:hypothetical protein
MNVRLTFPALVGAMLIAGSAYAGTSNMSGQATTSDVDRMHQEMTLAASDRCTSLENQWNGVKNQHKSASGFAQAEKSYNDGVKLCSSGNSIEGAKLIDKALHAIGVLPTS